MADSADARVVYGDHPDQFVDLWLPAEAPIGTIILIHGGYWRDVYGLDLFDPLATHLAQRGWAVLNIEYRRIAHDTAPPVWSDMAADVLSTTKIAQAHPVVAVGHSAGGQLALWLGAQDSGVDAVVALAPVADLRAADALNLSGGAVRALLGGSATELPARYDAASPKALLPLGIPQLVVHGDADESVPQHISIDYANAARAAGDDVTLLAPAGVDHMQIIDPDDDTWRLIDDQLTSWSEA